MTKSSLSIYTKHYFVLVGWLVDEEIISHSEQASAVSINSICRKKRRGECMWKMVTGCETFNCGHVQCLPCQEERHRNIPSSERLTEQPNQWTTAYSTQFTVLSSTSEEVYELSSITEDVHLPSYLKQTRVWLNSCCICQLSKEQARGLHSQADNMYNGHEQHTSKAERYTIYECLKTKTKFVWK